MLVRGLRGILDDMTFCTSSESWGTWGINRTLNRDVSVIEDGEMGLIKEKEERD